VEYPHCAMGPSGDQHGPTLSHRHLHRG
jgi:hypothetical protein